MNAANAPDKGADKSAVVAWQFERELEVIPPVRRAFLQIAADHCRIEFKLNGQKVLRLEPFCQTAELDVTHWWC